jgi:hypothetical protein
MDTGAARFDPADERREPALGSATHSRPPLAADLQIFHSIYPIEL